MENPPFWWYLPGKMGIFIGYVSLPEGIFWGFRCVRMYIKCTYLVRSPVHVQAVRTSGCYRKGTRGEWNDRKWRDPFSIAPWLLVEGYLIKGIRDSACLRFQCFYFIRNFYPNPSCMIQRGYSIFFSFQLGWKLKPPLKKKDFHDLPKARTRPVWPIPSMYDIYIYLPTWMVDFYGFHVG